MRECLICGDFFYGHVDDELCFSCASVPQYDENGDWVDYDCSDPDEPIDVIWSEA